ncbi:MAG: nucleotidyltransferase family protein [Bacteroidales bacterium]|nr:nucleotidyltransferase family protein [Bacteroidales bacterium]
MVTGSEIEILLRILKGDDLSDCAPGEWDAVALTQLAIRHKQAYPLLQFARQNVGFFPGELIPQIENHCRKSAFQSLSQLNELKRITGRLNDSGVSNVVIKGPQLSRMLYGREAMKESVDLDIMLVRGNDLPAVHALLTEAGYTRSNLNDYPGAYRRKLFLIAKREVSYYNPGNRIAIDLHIRPGANTYLTEHRFGDFFQRLKQYDLEGTPVTVLSDEAYFVYLCYHGALHQFGRLAWLADIRAFLKHKAVGMNFNEIQGIAGKWRVMNCVTLALRLIKDYFQEEYLPYRLPESWRLNYLETCCKKTLYQKPGYGIALSGRLSKTIYIGFLLEGMAARADWLYGITMRKLVPLLARKAKAN